MIDFLADSDDEEDAREPADDGNSAATTDDCIKAVQVELQAYLSQQCWISQLTCSSGGA